MLARIANVKTDPDELMERGKTSGLVRYLFNDDLSGSLNKEDFVKLQADLIHDVLEMEFTRYVKDTSEKISETDFCRHLLYSSAISQKKKEKMIKMVSDEFEGKSKGITFESFKTFYNVLFGGADLERAMFFLDSEKQGVTSDEFIKIANWVVGRDVDPHVVEVQYKHRSKHKFLNIQIQVEVQIQTQIQMHVFKNTNSGALLPAGRGRRPEPEHEGVQSGSLLVEELARVREGRSQRLLGQHEVLRRLSRHLVNTYVPILHIRIYIFIRESSSLFFTWLVDRKLRVN